MQSDCCGMQVFCTFNQNFYSCQSLSNKSITFKKLYKLKVRKRIGKAINMKRYKYEELHIWKAIAFMKNKDIKTKIDICTKLPSIL